LLRKCVAAGLAGHEIEGFTDGHDDAKVQLDPATLTPEAGNRFQQIGHIRLRPLIPLHIRIHRKEISTLQADTFPLAIRLHTPPINAKRIGFADRAPDSAQA